MCSETIEAKICKDNLQIQEKYVFFNFVPILSKHLFEWVAGCKMLLFDRDNSSDNNTAKGRCT